MGALRVMYDFGLMHIPGTWLWPGLIKYMSVVPPTCSSGVQVARFRSKKLEKEAAPVENTACRCWR